MRKILLCFLLMFGFINLANAEKMPDFKYKNIGIKDKISYNAETGSWSKKFDKKNNNYYTKVKGFGDFYDYLDSNKDFAFSTNCEYEFIYNDSLIGYSNRDMKFYEFKYDNHNINKRALTKEELEQIFPEYKIVSLSDFSEKTNSLKIKKNIGELKVMLYNDTDKTFDRFTFTSGNSKFEQYDLRGIMSVQKPGMIQFSNLEELDRKNWYVLLIR